MSDPDRDKIAGERRSCAALFSPARSPFALDPAVVGRIAGDRFTLEVRTLPEVDLPHVAAALNAR